MKKRKRHKPDEQNVHNTLEEIANKIKNGANPDDFYDFLNEILDTKMPVRDKKIEKAWELKNRRDKKNGQ